MVIVKMAAGSNRRKPKRWSKADPDHVWPGHTLYPFVLSYFLVG